MHKRIRNRMTTSHAFFAVTFLTILAVSKAVPTRPHPVQVDPPAPELCKLDTQGECDAVPCCTWCGSKWSPVGWCSQVASWAKNCTKSIHTCEYSANQTQCCSSNMCQWLPKDEKHPTTCMNPDPPTPPTPPGPPPTFSCSLTTAEECDASACCTWSVAFRQVLLTCLICKPCPH